jgi:hypothetical protein
MSPLLHVGLEERINSFPLIGKEMLSAMAEVPVGRQIQISSCMAERLFRAFDHTCRNVLTLCLIPIHRDHVPINSLKTRAGSANGRD